MGIEIDPVYEIYARYPFPPVEASGKGWKKRIRNRIAEGREIGATLLESEPDLARGRILDAGVGTGMKLLGISEVLPEAKIRGFDVSQASIAIARRIMSEAGLSNVTLTWGNLMEGYILEGELPYDAVICDGVLHHLKNPAQGLQNLVEALRAGGFGWITLFGKYGREDIGRLRRMLNILEPRFLCFDRRLTTSRALLRATGFASNRHNKFLLEDDTALADSMLNPRETWYDLVSARRLFEGAGLGLVSWVDGEKYWGEFVRNMKSSGMDPDSLEIPLSDFERMRLVELWKCPGMLRFLVRKTEAAGEQDAGDTPNTASDAT